jgi:TP901 family phage tail tape measure protein
MAMGGGGGVPNMHIAEAFASLVWRDKAYYDGLRRAEKALYAFGVKANTLGRTLGVGMAGSAAHFVRLERSVNSLTRSLFFTNTQASKLLRTLRSIGATRLPGGTPGMFSAYGTGMGRIISAYGTAIGRVALGVGNAVGNMLGRTLRGGGQGGGQFIKHGFTGFGSLLNQTARGFASVLSSGLHGSASLLRSLVAAVMTPIRALRGIAGIGGLVGLVGGGVGTAAAIRTAADQERTLATLRRITGASPSQMAALSSGINRTAARTPGVSLDKFYEVAETGARMGIPTSELRAFAEGMAKLGAVLDENELPLQEAANRIGSLISVFKLSTDWAEKLGSALVKLDQMSTASARDIIDITNRFAGTAAKFNVTPDKALALATTMRQARIPVETAGTSYGQIVQRMASSKDMGQFAKLAGMNRKDFGALLETDNIEALNRVLATLGKMGAVEASRALDKLSLDGQRVRGTMLQLSSVSDFFSKALAASSDQVKSQSAVLEGLQIQAKTFGAQWEATKTGFKLLAIELGKGLLPAMKGLAAGLRNFAADASAFTSRNGPALEKWGEKVRMVMETIGVLWRQWPDAIAYASVTVQEKLAQLVTVFGNFGKQVGDNLKWLVSNIPAMLGNAIKEVGPKILPMLADLGRQVKEAVMTGDSGAIGKTALAAGAVVGTGLGRRLLGGAYRLGRGAIGLAGRAAGWAGRTAMGAAPGVAGWIGRNASAAFGAARGFMGGAGGRVAGRALAMAANPVVGMTAGGLMMAAGASQAIGRATGWGDVAASKPGMRGWIGRNLLGGTDPKAASREAFEAKWARGQAANRTLMDAVGAPAAGPAAPAMTAIPKAPGFSVAGLMAGTSGLMGGDGETFEEKKKRLANGIKGGIFLKRAQRFMENTPPMLGTAATIASNPMGAAAGLAGFARGRLQGILPSGGASVGNLVPGTRAYAAAMARKQAGYGPRGGGVDVSTIASPVMGPTRPALFGERMPVLAAADGGVGTASGAVNRGEGRAADTYGGRVWAANRARRGAVNAGFRQWRSNVNAMMRGQAPMMGDGRREVGSDPNDPAKKIDKTNDLLSDILGAMKDGAAGPAGKGKGGGAVAVVG